MTTYAIGDIQGCARSFDALLEAIDFDPGADRLWLAGDLVNRGPDSVGVLRRVMALGDRAVVVLGNHDLHLLAIVAGVRPPWEGDTFDEIFAAPDRDELIDWLRCRPLLHYDPAIRTVLVHAGLPPGWSLEEAVARAGEVVDALAGVDWQDVLQTLYGNEPSAWSAGLSLADRRRFTINALTRMRYVDAAGRLDFEYNGPPGTQPSVLTPWYEMWSVGDGDDGEIHGSEIRGSEIHDSEVHVVFGHWASLGLVSLSRRYSRDELIVENIVDNAEDVQGAGDLRGRTPGARFTCMDTGCVWGRTLTALPVDPPGKPVAVGCVEAGLAGSEAGLLS